MPTELLFITESNNNIINLVKNNNQQEYQILTEAEEQITIFYEINQMSANEILDLVNKTEHKKKFITFKLEDNIYEIFEKHELYGLPFKNPICYSMLFRTRDIHARTFVSKYLRRDDIYIHNDCCQYEDSDDDEEIMLTGRQFAEMIDKYPDWFIYGYRYPEKKPKR